jgi:hypothetical protein
MASKSFQSLSLLHELLSTSQQIVKLFHNQAEFPQQDTTQTINALQTWRSGLLLDRAHHNEELLSLAQEIGVLLPEFFIDCVTVIGLASAMQGVLSRKIQSKFKIIPQSETHELVDLWGQVESSKALFEFVVRYIEEYAQSNPGDRHISLNAIQAQCRVLSLGLERLMIELGSAYAKHSSVGEVAQLVDWSLCLMRKEQYKTVEQAITCELSSL